MQQNENLADAMAEVRRAFDIQPRPTKLVVSAQALAGAHVVLERMKAADERMSLRMARRFRGPGLLRRIAEMDERKVLWQRLVGA